MANEYSCLNARVKKQCDASDDVAGVSKNHIAGKSRHDVKMLHFYAWEVSKFPRKIGMFFSNIVALSAPYSYITEIHKEDFRGLRKLRFLYLGHNFLKTLDSDVFNFIPKLEYLAINSNRELAHVGYGVLDKLPNLRILHGQNTGCGAIVDVFNDNSQAIENFKNQLRTGCPPTQEMIQRTKFSTWDEEEEDDDDVSDADEFFSNALRRSQPQFQDSQCEQKYSV